MQLQMRSLARTSACRLGLTTGESNTFSCSISLLLVLGHSFDSASSCSSRGCNFFLFCFKVMVLDPSDF